LTCRGVLVRLVRRCRLFSRRFRLRLQLIHGVLREFRRPNFLHELLRLELCRVRLVFVFFPLVIGRRRGGGDSFDRFSPDLADDFVMAASSFMVFGTYLTENTAFPIPPTQSHFSLDE
jgi:hypothetical protein